MCQHVRWRGGEELADCGISPADLTLAFIHYFDTLSLSLLPSALEKSHNYISFVFLLRLPQAQRGAYGMCWKLPISTSAVYFFL